MAHTVHASSLATVVDLADNPPKDLPNYMISDVEAAQPLILYIARVPGSRGLESRQAPSAETLLKCRIDVFLTTMKPQQRVVTAQDVQSCLYYVHAESERDKELLNGENGASEDGPPDTSLEAVHKTLKSSTQGSVRRKPVLPRRTLSKSQGSNVLSSHLSTPSTVQPSETNIKRKPISTNGIFPQSDTRQSRPTKPSGPRPLQAAYRHQEGSTTLTSVPQRHNIDTRRGFEQPPKSFGPPLPLRPYEQKQQDLDDKYAANCASYPSSYGTNGISPSEDSEAALSRLDGNSANLSSPSLTLIRRYNNTQSNVGQVLEWTRADEPITFDIFNASYQKFSGTGTSETESKPRLSKLDSECANPYRCNIQPLRSSTRPHSGIRSESSESSTASIREGLRNSFDLRRSTMLGSTGYEKGMTNHETALLQKQGATKGYMLRSPWLGTCEFSTGVAGRSLKCRHIRPSNIAIESFPVSELRFNLPSSKTFGSPAPKSPLLNATQGAKRLSYFSHNRQRSSFESMHFDAGHTVDSSEEFDERLDLSLGQEHAGGGFGGRQAKLGKLIIEQEGLQMLDLVVAANMALWWRVYDKTV